MYARLTVIRGATTQQVDLRLPTIIGRGNEAKLKLPSSTVSRQHCEVYEYDGQIAIRDLDSSNGTVVNGHQIDYPTLITPQDDVAIGPVCFRLAVVAAESEEKRSVEQPAKEDLPKFVDIPAEINSPQQAELATADQESHAHLGEVPSDGEGSVLKYVEPQEEGQRSFVGIVEEVPPASTVSEPPSIDTRSPDCESVDGEDSLLKNFFKNLDS